MSQTIETKSSKTFVTKGRLVKVLESLMEFIPRRHPNEFCKCVRIDFNQEDVSLVATDRETTLRRDLCVPEYEAESGSVLINARRFYQVIQEIPIDQGDFLRLSLQLSKTVDRLVIDFMNGKITLDSEDVEKFPQVSGPVSAAKFSIDMQELREGLNRTVFACDYESTRYSLGCSCIHLAKSKPISFIGTDSRRLSVYESSAIGDVDAIVLVPSQATTWIAATIPQLAYEDDAVVEIGPKFVRISMAGSEVFTSRAEGRYPQYTDVIRKENPSLIKGLAAEWLNVFKTASRCVSDERRAVSLNFQASGVCATVQNPVDGIECEILQKIRLIEGPEITMLVDPRMVVPFFEQLGPSTEVTLGLKDVESSLQFTTDDGSRLVAMPVSVND